jgi:hypothetical protein
MKSLIRMIISVVLLSTVVFASGGNEKITSFSKAKKILKTKIYNEKKLMIDKYTNCSY